MDVTFGPDGIIVEVFDELQLRNLKIKVCCEAFAKATQGSTDNEGWMPLFHWNSKLSQWQTGTNQPGSELPSLKYCPWCGMVCTYSLHRRLQEAKEE